MKKIMLLAIMLFFSTANIVSQEAYKSLLTEGKTWDIVTTNTSPTDYEDRASYIKLQGDTIDDGHACKILVHTNSEYTWKSVLWKNDKTIFFVSIWPGKRCRRNGWGGKIDVRIEHFHS